MKTVKVSDIFNVQYGNSFELNKLKQVSDGINFVSRTAKNNGVSAIVKEVDNIEPFESGLITVSLGGSVLETFIQPAPFYTGYHIYCLEPIKEMSISVKLYYCACISANKYRYNYGRQANRTLRDLQIPALSEVPSKISETDLSIYEGLSEPLIKKNLKLNTDNWKWFSYDLLFDIERGKGPRKKDLDGKGNVPFVTASDKNNGWTAFTSYEPIHKGNTIGVNRNGSVAESFYQPVPFCSTEDVHIFTAKFSMNKYVALFLSTLIKKEKYRYNYGRKWGIARMKKSKIKLPVKKNGELDLEFMENYIKSMNYSRNI